MMRALYAGVSGLKTHQVKMDVIGNNIANVNTVAYKSSSISFSEIMYQTVQSASGANALTGTGGTNARQIGLGVTSGAITTNIKTQGGNQNTGDPFDLKITGDSFFVVNNGTSNYFTRSGAFYVDGAGNLAMRSTGYNVMGWQVDDATGAIRKDTVSRLQIMSPENLTAEPEATTLANVSGILDADDPNLKNPTGSVMTLSVTDKLGYAYTLKMGIKPVMNAVTTTKTVNNTSTEYTLPASITKEDVTTYSYALADGSITSISIPASMKADLDAYMQANPTVTTITLGTDITPTGLTTSDPLYGKVLTVTSTTSTVYKTAGGAPINIDDALVGELYTSAGGTPEAFNLNPGVTIVKQDKAYADGTAPSVAYTIFDGTTHTELANTTNIDNLLSASTSNVLSSYTSTESVTTTEPVDGQYTVSITGLLDQNGEEMDISALGNPADLNYNLTYSVADGTFVGINGENAVNVNLSALGTNFENVSVDFSTSKNQSTKKGTSTIKAAAGDTDKVGAGKKLGAMIGVSISQNGMIYGTYDNGSTKLLGQIATANFANASGLSKEGENLYAQTLNSGEFDGIGQDVTADGGSISSGMLEMSNVDLSSEFTEMITTQRGFQANSRIITTSDTLLEELINLKR